MIESHIARRYLWASRKQAHTAFLSIISMLGLALGVAVLLFSLALLTGLQMRIKGNLIASSPQILVEPIGKNTIDDADALVAAAKRAGMTTVRPLVTGIGWGANEEEKRGRPMRLRSYVRGAEPPSDSLSRRVWKPAEGEPTILLTRDFAAALGLDLGDTVTVVAPRTRLTPFGPVPVYRRYRIVRLVSSGVSEERGADGYMETSDAESFFNTGGKPTSIEMFGNADRAEEVQAALTQRFPNVLVKTWKEINRPLFLALRLEKIVMFATISLIIFVAALNLISSLSMLIVEKRPQVGVLRTLGATEKSILSIFMQVGLLIGITGTLLGNVLGIGVAYAANRWHLIPLPSEFYFFRYLPFTLDPGDVIGVNVVAVCLSVIATWYPAHVASRLDPITAIREE